MLWGNFWLCCGDDFGYVVGVTFGYVVGVLLCGELKINFWNLKLVTSPK